MNTSRHLTRSSTNRWIAGVCGGIAEYLGVDPLVVRFGFILLVWFGLSPLIYLVLWVVLPSDQSTAQGFSQQVRENVSELEQTARSAAQKVGVQVDRLVSRTKSSQSSQSEQQNLPQDQEHNGPSVGPTTRL